ncbi:hypothetical protein BHM03_00008033 [Ensete ventricosum]|nr:hypothetical protein BHM03_00008033 [Ensete ventricosum]
MPCFLEFFSLAVRDAVFLKRVALLVSYYGEQIQLTLSQSYDMRAESSGEDCCWRFITIHKNHVAAHSLPTVSISILIPPPQIVLPAPRATKHRPVIVIPRDQANDISAVEGRRRSDAMRSCLLDPLATPRLQSGTNGLPHLQVATYAHPMS